MKFALWFLLSVSLLESPAFAQSVPSTVASDLDQIVRDTIQANTSFSDAGIAVGVIKDGQVIFANGYGLRDWAQHLPVTSQTRFAIGSNTKSFTALGLGILKDRVLSVQFDFDIPVKIYLPEFKLIDGSISAILTPADMLSHRSGLARHDMMWWPGHYSRNDIVRRMQYLEMDARPEYGYHRLLNYNNLMFAAAGTITETLSPGRSWEEFTLQEILAPLGMNSTSFALDGRSGNPEASLSYKRDGSLSSTADVTNIGPAGSMNSTIMDMLKYLDFYLSGGVNPSGDRLISQATLLSLFKSRTQLAPDSTIFGSPNVCFSGAANCINYYGLGWAVQYDGTNYLAYHGGHIDGFYSFMSIVGAKKLGVVVLNNVDHNPAVLALGKAINQYFINGQIMSVGTPMPSQGNTPGPLDMNVGMDAAVEKAPQSSTPAFTTVGTFTHQGYGDVAILYDGTSLYMKYFDDCYWKIKPTVSPYWVSYSFMLSPTVISPTSSNMYLDRGGVPGGSVQAIYPFFEPHAWSRFNKK